MARVLDRLPAPRRSKSWSRTPRSLRTPTRAPSTPDRVGWSLGDERRLAQAPTLGMAGSEPSANVAGRERAAIMVGDVMRYAATAHGLALTIDQARGILDRCGWLTYSAMDWIDRLIAAAQSEAI